MTTAAALLAEVHRRGATARRVGDRIDLQPATALPADLLVQLREHKIDLLGLLSDDAGAEPVGPWRIVVESCRPRQGPIKINAATTVTDPVLCIEHILIELERAVLHKNAGRETAFTALIDEHLQYLTACGCHVRVERVS